MIFYYAILHLFSKTSQNHPICNFFWRNIIILYSYRISTNCLKDNGSYNVQMSKYYSDRCYRHLLLYCIILLNTLHCVEILFDQIWRTDRFWSQTPTRWSFFSHKNSLFTQFVFYLSSEEIKNYLEDFILTLLHYFFYLTLFLEARVEILKKISLIFWSKRWHQKDILKLTDL